MFEIVKVEFNFHHGFLGDPNGFDTEFKPHKTQLVLGHHSRSSGESARGSSTDSARHRAAVPRAGRSPGDRCIAFGAADSSGASDFSSKTVFPVESFSYAVYEVNDQ